MIRFACPGCEAQFTVGDEKAGKTGKCPKCATQFVIPAAPDAPGVGDVFTPPPPVAPPPVAPPPPPPAADDGVEIKPCPGCQKRLTVDAEDLGQGVECPYCQTVYTAERPGASPPRKRPSNVSDALSGIGDRPKSDDDERPSRRRRDEAADDEEEPPARRRRERDQDDDEDERPSRRRRERDENEDEDDQPRRRRRRRRRSLEPHRGGLLLTLSIVGCCCGILSIATLIMAQGDLGKMSRGEMDDSGKGLTIAALILAILGTIGMVINIILRVAEVGGK